MVYYTYSTMLYVSLTPKRAIEALVSDGLRVEVSYNNFVAFGGKAIEDRYIHEILDNVSTISNSVDVVHIPYDEMEPEVALSPNGLARFIKWIDFINKINGKIAVIHPLYAVNRALELNLEFFRYIVREARDRGIAIAIENIIEKHLFGSRPKELIQLISVLDGDVGICLDIGHANINKNIDEFLNTAGRYIKVMHIHDNDGYRDQHKPPTTGTVDWNKIETWIMRTRYNGFIVFEVVCRDNINICRNVVKYIKSLRIANI
ncbi:MAG: TIM barrel protein [Ignisphaera sp.]|uniref:Sugar phosphate isomerase/epimerase n=1 Tax=Ignisphaera aggregans TaxID=334771 RepID=A0A7J3MYA6_9CREN